MEQISGCFMIYKPVLAIKYGDFIAWGSLQLRYSNGFLKYLKNFVRIFARVIARSWVILLWAKNPWALGQISVHYHNSQWHCITDKQILSLCDHNGQWHFITDKDYRIWPQWPVTFHYWQRLLHVTTMVIETLHLKTNDRCDRWFQFQLNQWLT